MTFGAIETRGIFMAKVYATEVTKAYESWSDCRPIEPKILGTWMENALTSTSNTREELP